MSITFNKCSQRVALLLGAVEGADVSTSETNYTGTISTSTVRPPDFPPTAILDSCVEAAMMIAHAICESDAHPETTTFRVLSSATATGAAVPSTSSGSVPRIGPIRRVYDSSSTNRSLMRTTSQRVNDYLRQTTGAFGAYTPYLYAINGNTLEHTRTNVICEFCGFTRATITVNIGGTDIIPLNDEHEPYIVYGATAILAGKETQYMALAQQCDQKFQIYIQNIRSYPDVATNITGAAIN